ncbi:MAG: hypothetical protein QXU98_09125 [Candidatus Parvarchaeota archaeon]
MINRMISRLESEFNLESVSVNLPYVEKALDAYYPIVYVEFFSSTRKFDGRKYGCSIDDVCLDEVGRRIEIGVHKSERSSREIL